MYLLFLFSCFSFSEDTQMVLSERMDGLYAYVSKLHNQCSASNYSVIFVSVGPLLQSV